MRYDPQERAIVLCAVNIFANQSTAWTYPQVFQTSKAPRFHKGNIYVACNSAALMVWSWVTLFFYKRQEKRDARANGIVLYNSEKGEIPIEVREHLSKTGVVGHRDNTSEDDHALIDKNIEKVETISL